MQETISKLLQASGQQVLWAGGFFVLFAVLAFVTPCNRTQPRWSSGMPTDLLYYFIIPILTRFVHVIFMSAGIGILFYGQSPAAVIDYIKHGYGPLSHMPIWLQAAIIFVLSDIILYWTHRWFHGQQMWRFHAIHHSPVHVDWHTTYRFHPVNTWLSFTLVDALMLLAGFSPEATGAMVVFNQVYSAMVHANLNWTFGPLRYVFASPVFHRWHHTAQAEGLDKNFAPTFPLIDIMFGTFYMPEGRRPEVYGITGGTIPEGFIGQIVWPFKNRG